MTNKTTRKAGAVEVEVGEGEEVKTKHLEMKEVVPTREAIGGG